MKIDYIHYVPRGKVKSYIATVATEYVDGCTHVGVAYQGKKDDFDETRGADIAMGRCAKKPQIVDLSKHETLTSIIANGLPEHMKRCHRIFTDSDYIRWRDKVNLAKDYAREVKKEHNKQLIALYKEIDELIN